MGCCGGLTSHYQGLEPRSAGNDVHWRRLRCDPSAPVHPGSWMLPSAACKHSSVEEALFWFRSRNRPPPPQQLQQKRVAFTPREQKGKH